MLPPSDEYEKFWQYLRRLEDKVDSQGIAIADLRLDLDSERKRSIAIHRGTGRNKWASIAAAIIAIAGAIAQLLRH